jgi:lipoprotein-anchoring transpeptidase ErfK/SrfK
MLRRKLLRAIPAASAVALCAWSGGYARAYANELDAPGSGSVWRGTVKDPGARIHARPSTSAEVQAELPPGDPVEIDQWVAGTQVYPTLITWGHLADGRGYVYGSTVRPRPADTPPAPPADGLTWTSNWIDVNLTANVITAYEGPVARGFFPTSPGRPGWETTRGKHVVLSQMAVQDMAGPGYYVHDVQWISYFLSDGEAIHARTWDLDAISLGVPSSHGCLGVGLEAAAFLYKFAAPGTPVFVHD